MMTEINKNAIYVMDTLEAAGYEAYIVGGCVRDIILGKMPKDWDVTTNALPHQVKGLFSHTMDTGLKHGTVTVVCHKEHIEVTTYRSDGEYEDFRRPSTVEYVSDIKTDLLRRDFTINALAYSPKRGLIDLSGGDKDIKERKIRCVGEAQRRFSEDALRMLRAVRFACTLGFEIENNTFEYIKNCAKLIVNISAERIRDEIFKALVSDYPANLYLLIESGLCHLILPELNQCFKTPQNHPYHIYDVGTHMLKAVENTPKSLILRLAAVLHDIGKIETRTTDDKGIDHFYNHGKVGASMARDILNRLRTDNETKAAVISLILRHDSPIEPTAASVRRATAKIGPELFPLLLLLKKADAMGQNPEKTKGKLDAIKKIEDLYNDIIISGDALCLKDIAVNGKDLMDIGYKEGKDIGEALKILLEMVIASPEWNNRSFLLNFAKERLNK